MNIVIYLRNDNLDAVKGFQHRHNGQADNIQ